MMYTLVKDMDEVRVITILVEVIQFSNYEEVFTKIKNAISEFNAFIVLDLAKVKFMDSLSLGMLVPLLLYTRRLGGDMIIVVEDKKIMDLFRMLRLDKILRISDTVEEAAKYFTQEEVRDVSD